MIQLAPSKVLVVAPHTDDETIGPGGTLVRLRDRGSKIHLLVFSSAIESIPQGMPLNSTWNEFDRVKEKLGATGDLLNLPVRKFFQYRQTILEKLREYRNFDLVFCPSPNDDHQDHAVVAAEAMRAFWNKPCLAYEIPKKTLRFSPSVFVSLKFMDLEQKIELVSLYKSQTVKPNFSGSKDILEATARFRGIQAGTELAEAFEVPRILTAYVPLRSK